MLETVSGSDSILFPPLALTDPNANAAQQALLQQQLNVLAYSPYGDSPLFRNPLSDPKKKEEVSGWSFTLGLLQSS